MTDEELYLMAKELGAPYHLLKETARLKRLPVVSSPSTPSKIKPDRSAPLFSPRLTSLPVESPRLQTLRS